MHSARKLISLLLVMVLIVLTAVACGDQDTSSKKKKKKKVIIVKKNESSDVSSDIPESDDDFDYDFEDDEEYEDDSDKRELYSGEDEEEGPYKEKFTPEYTVAAVDFDGPNGYVIVYPKNDHQLMVAAKKIQTYYAEKCGITLEVKDDSAAATAKEILVGDTNRAKSALKETEFAVTYKDGKVYVESGHFNGAIKAAKWFVSLGYEKGKLNTLKGTYDDFESSKTVDNQVYNLVWADEFDGTTLDNSNWELSTHMGSGYANMILSYDKKVLNVSDGRLKLSAQHWFDPDDPSVNLAVPYTVEGKKHVNVRYGYMELKARYPVKQGGWPSWWMAGTCEDGVAANYLPEGNVIPSTFRAEIDILEYNICRPGLLKWYNVDIDGDTENESARYHHSKRADGTLREINALNPTEESSYVYTVFGFLWNDKELKFYCNGEMYAQVDLSDNFDSTNVTDVAKGLINDMSDYLNPMFFRFNNHLEVDKVPTNFNSLPIEYYIDWLRVYQLPSTEQTLWLAE